MFSPRQNLSDCRAEPSQESTQAQDALLIKNPVAIGGWISPGDSLEKSPIVICTLSISNVIESFMSEIHTIQKEKSNVVMSGVYVLVEHCFILLLKQKSVKLLYSMYIVVHIAFYALITYSMIVINCGCNSTFSYNVKTLFHCSNIYNI